MHGRDVVVTMMNGTPDAARHGPGGARSLVGPADADARPAHDPAKDRDLFWRIKEKTGEQLRQEFLSTYVPRLWEIGLTLAGPGAAPRRGDRRVALHRARLAGAAHGGHRPRPDVPGAARLPPRSTTTQTAWVRDDPAPRPRPDARPSRRRVDRGRRPTSGPTAWEVFRQEKDGDPMRHGGQRPRARRRAGPPLRARAVQPSPGERPPVGRAATEISDLERSGPAPAAARPLVQEAGRLRDARQARPPRASSPGPTKPRGDCPELTGTPPTGDLVPATRDALSLLLLTMADDEFVIGFRDSEWTGIAPMLEEDVAFSSLAQDEIGHARRCTRCSPS